MNGPPPSGRSVDLCLLAFGIALLLLASPIRQLWAVEGLPWPVPFLVWLAVIGLGAWAGRTRKGHET